MIHQKIHGFLLLAQTIIIRTDYYLYIIHVFGDKSISAILQNAFKGNFKSEVIWTNSVSFR